MSDEAVVELPAKELLRLQSIESAARAFMPSLNNLRVDTEAGKGVVGFRTYNPGSARLFDKRLIRLGRALDIFPYNLL
jgi:hypothetical protein